MQVSRAFVAARALSQALATGRDIVNKATKVRYKICWVCLLQNIKIAKEVQMSKIYLL